MTSADLATKIKSADAVCSSLAALAARGVLPLSIVVYMFDSRVEGIMPHGRWLWALSPGMENILEKVYLNWARSLLAPPSWRNGAVAAAELGWTHSGFPRACVDVAGLRAGLWVLDPHDFYQKIFVAAHQWGGTRGRRYRPIC